ncbi:Uncharacterized protein DAT39_001267, partial [Clarias magur]
MDLSSSNYKQFTAHFREVFNYSNPCSHQWVERALPFDQILAGASTATEAADGDPRRLCWVGAVHETHHQSRRPFAGLRCRTSCNGSVPTSPPLTKPQVSTRTYGHQSNTSSTFSSGKTTPAELGVMPLLRRKGAPASDMPSAPSKTSDVPVPAFSLPPTLEKEVPTAEALVEEVDLLRVVPEIPQ